MWRRFAALLILVGAFLGLGMSVAHACDGGYWSCTELEQGTYCLWYPY